MSFSVIDAEQRSPEWFEARVGRVTGSRAADFLAVRKDGKPTTGRRNYLTDLVIERLTNTVQENGYQNAHMERGIEREADALAQYEALTGQIVRHTGFLAHDTLPVGVSLDGDIGNFTGIAEAKCPIPAIHLEYLKSRKVPKQYASQITHALWMTGAEWGDFLSYCPEFPPPLDVCLVRIERDQEAIDAYEKQLVGFLAEVEAEEQAVKTMALGIGAVLAS